MAQINNHEFYGLDTDYVTKHKELFDFFDSQNLDVEINDDFAELKTILTSKDKDDYAYDFDSAFESYLDNATGFILYLRYNNEIVATYAAKKLGLNTFLESMRLKYPGNYDTIDDFSGQSAYSSCQWVSKEHRGKKWGRVLDHLKKHICFDLMKCDTNYAIHKSDLRDYHVNHLAYSNNKKLAVIPNGDVGGAGEVIDKEYWIAYSSNTEWADKQSEVKTLYT
tara:strand:+ start:233 stop:901 length:669 start_codon:yes stop_codon:yes gene_type:complete